MKKLALLFLLPVLILTTACGGKEKAPSAWFNNTEFMQAIQRSDAAAVSGIIATSPINIKARRADGYTPLILAAETASYETVKALLDAGAELDATDNNGNTALTVAAMNNKNPEIIKTLILAGADLNAVNNQGLTPLFAAAQYNTNPKVLLTMLSAISADKDQLLKAISKNPNAYNITDAYLSEPVKVTVKIPWYNNNSFKKALAENNIPALQEQIQRTDLLSLKNNLDALGTALSDKNASPETIKLLLKAGANAAANYSAVATPLQIAAANTDKPEIIAMLLQAGAKANTVSSKGMTPLYAAIINNPAPEKILPLLIQAGADVNTNTLEYPPLATAISITDNEIVPLLLVKAGAKVNDEGAGRFYPPLLMAVQKNTNEKIVYLLLNSKADPDVKDANGMTPLMLAMGQNANEKITLALLNASKNLPPFNDALGLAARNKNEKVGQLISGFYKDYEAKHAAELKAKGISTEPELGINWYDSKELVQAIQDSDVQALRKALAKPYNLEALMENKLTALMFAAGLADKELILYDLIAAGANPNATNSNGDTALMMAALINQYPKAITALVQNGANVNAMDKNGGTALMSAVNSNPNEQVVIALLQAGAKIGNKEKMLKYAENNSNPRIKQILQQ